MNAWYCFWNPKDAARRINEYSEELCERMRQQHLARLAKPTTVALQVKQAVEMVLKDREHSAYQAGYSAGRADASEVPDLKAVINKRDQLRTEGFRAGVDAARKKDTS